MGLRWKVPGESVDKAISSPPAATRSLLKGFADEKMKAVGRLDARNYYDGDWMFRFLFQSFIHCF